MKTNGLVPGCFKCERLNAIGNDSHPFKLSRDDRIPRLLSGCSAHNARVAVGRVAVKEEDHVQMWQRA